MRSSGSLTSMKAKILLRFGIIAFILLIVGGVFAAGARRIKGAQARVTDYTDDRMLLQKAVADHFRWANGLNSAINYDTKFTGSIDPKSCEFGKFLYSPEVQNNPEWADLIQNTEPLHNQIHAGAVEALSQSDHERAKEIYLDNIRPALDELTAGLYDQIEVQSGKVESARQSVARLMDFQMASVILQIIILLFMLSGAFFFIRREVIIPILQIRGECGRLALECV